MANRRATRLDAGRRDKLITIQQRPVEDVPDEESGEPTAEWTTLAAQLPACRIDLSATERERLARLSASNTVAWQINYRADCDPELIDVPKLRRIVYGGRIYNITGAMQIARRVGIELETLVSSEVPA